MVGEDVDDFNVPNTKEVKCEKQNTFVWADIKGFGDLLNETMSDDRQCRLTYTSYVV